MAHSTPILPSLHAPDEHTFLSRLHICEGSTEMVHIDITDGRFVPNKDWADPQTISTSTTPLRYELHLMVEDPLAILHQWKDIQNIGRIIVHAESPKMDIVSISELAHAHDWQIGAGFKLETDPTAYESLIQELNPTHVLCMGIHGIGFSGQHIDLAALVLLVKALKDTFEQSTTWQWIIDGGVKKENIKNLKQIGFTTFVLTTEIFEAPDPKQRIQELQTLVQ